MKCSMLLLLLSRFSHVQLCASPEMGAQAPPSPGKNTGVGCYFLLQCMRVKSESEVPQSCPTLHAPMDCSLLGSSVHGICQARVLEWVAIAFSCCYCYCLGISNFLERSLDFSFSSFLYFFALITEEGFLTSPWYFGNSAFKQVYLPFSPLSFTSLLLTAICKVSS